MKKLHQRTSSKAITLKRDAQLALMLAMSGLAFLSSTLIFKLQLLS